MADTPTSRMNRWFRERGYLPGIVEKWNHRANIRQDLFGFADIFAVGDGTALLVQVCGEGDHAKRLRKVMANEHVPHVLKNRVRVWVVEWRKVKRNGRMVYRPLAKEVFRLPTGILVATDLDLESVDPIE